MQGAVVMRKGRTSFIASIMTVLIHTPPLAEAVLRGDLASDCETQTDALPVVCWHIKKALTKPKEPLSVRVHGLRSIVHTVLR